MTQKGEMSRESRTRRKLMAQEKGAEETLNQEERERGEKMPREARQSHVLTQSLMLVTVTPPSLVLGNISAPFLSSSSLNKLFPVFI